MVVTTMRDRSHKYILAFHHLKRLIQILATIANTVFVMVLKVKDRDKFGPEL